MHKAAHKWRHELKKQRFLERKHCDSNFLILPTALPYRALERRTRKWRCQSAVFAIEWSDFVNKAQNAYVKLKCHFFVQHCTRRSGREKISVELRLFIISNTKLDNNYLIRSDHDEGGRILRNSGAYYSRATCTMYSWTFFTVVWKLQLIRDYKNGCGKIL